MNRPSAPSSRFVAPERAGPTEPSDPAPSSFFGRAEELDELLEALEGSRLITLTGAPGVGKTRLAVELASRLGCRRGLVDLAPIGDPGLIQRRLAGALSLPEVPGQSLTATVVADLRREPFLLVLDNCEHLVGACAELADSLLAACPELAILATSREPLTVDAELVWPVAPLAVPDAEQPASPELMMNYAAVGLFVDRACAAKPGFALNSYVAPDVAQICRRLDGIPLAVELAAARVDMLTPAEIARRLDDRFGLLSGRGRVAGPRHDTLLAALDWSHELLSAAERALLARLSVFVGSFDPEAVEAVCAGGEIGAGDTQALLASLRAKSLVVGGAGCADPARDRLLETIRAYARGRLEDSGETATLRDAHARFYRALAERAEPELTGGAQARWFERLEAERTNLRFAIEWSLSRGDGESALRLTGALVLFWRVRCHFSEGLELLDAAVGASNDDAGRWRARALWGLGFMALMTGRLERAVAALEESLSGARELGDRQGEARALLILGNARQASDEQTAISLLERSAAVAREVGDSWCLAHALGVAGHDHACRQQSAAARPLLEECLAVAREADDKQSLRYGLVSLGFLAVGQGEYHEARRVLEEALAIADVLGEDYTKAWALQLLAQVAIGCGDYGRARVLLDEALARTRAAGTPSDLVNTLSASAMLALGQGDRRRSRRLLEEALAVGRAEAGALIAAIQGMGELVAAEGDRHSAHRLFAEALDLARAGDDARDTARALRSIGLLARGDGELKQAAVAHHEALALQHRVGDMPGFTISLEAIAGLVAAAGHPEHAARLFGAATALREDRGYARHPWESPRYESDVALARGQLSAERFEAVFTQGRRLSVDEALAQASKRRGLAKRAASGWRSLTESERQVAGLAAEGLNNPEIAELLFISRGTVKDHLSHVFSKLGISGRIALAREVGRREGPPAGNAG